MTRFTASNHSAATLKSSRKDVWDALTDPRLLPKLTPYLHRIDVDGDRWTWNVAKVPMLGKSIGTTFTEVMTFDEPRRIGFTHDETRTDESSRGGGGVPPRGGGHGLRRVHRPRRDRRASVSQGDAPRRRGRRCAA